VFKLPPEKHTGGTVGTGSGNGVGRGPDEEPFSYVLNGRTLVNPPKVEYAGAESGRIVLDIVVDTEGKVLSAEPGRGTTTTAQDLTKAVRKAALAARFNAAPQANEQQRGRMSFSFAAGK